METSGRTCRRFGSVSAVTVGGILLSWGLLSIASSTWHITTFAPLDTALATVSHYLWVPALGFLFIHLGLLRNIQAKVQTSEFWLTASLIGGTLLLGLGAFFTLISLNTLAGAIYVAPILLSGLGLLVGGAYAQKGNWPVNE